MGATCSAGILNQQSDINSLLNQVTGTVVEAYLLPAIELMGLVGNFVCGSAIMSLGFHTQPVLVLVG